MKYTLQLKSETKEGWIEAVLANFPHFMQDHADCERKASSMCMSFVAKFSDRHEILGDLIATAVEELDHFEQVYKLMRKRGVNLPSEMAQDDYVNKMIKLCRSGREDRFLDRLVLASLLEARGAERFRIVSENIDEEELKKFYHMLGVSEARHCHIFLKMANIYFDEKIITERAEFLSDKEAEILNNLPFRATLH